MLISIIIVALIGFIISMYTFFIEQRLKQEPDYKPACDINDRISCTKPIKSEYANLFYFSNAVLGMVYYLMVALLAYLNMGTLLVIATIGGCVASLVLASILFFKIESLCVLCISLYVINITLLILALPFARGLYA
jgi:vitamin-K-epoxide reductase (warfarin-sensitive)